MKLGNHQFRFRLPWKKSHPTEITDVPPNKLTTKGQYDGQVHPLIPERPSLYQTISENPNLYLNRPFTSTSMAKLPAVRERNERSLHEEIGWNPKTHRFGSEEISPNPIPQKPNQPFARYNASAPWTSPPPNFSLPKPKNAEGYSQPSINPTGKMLNPNARDVQAFDFGFGADAKPSATE